MLRLLATLLVGLAASPAAAAQFFTDTDLDLATGTAPTAATPFPGTITVSGLGTVAKVTVQVGLTHTQPDDIDLLLVGPGGQKVVLMSDAGGTGDVSGIVLTFDQAAGSAVADSTTLVSATVRPADYGADTWPAGAPAGPYATTLDAFIGQPANGTWSLYASDDTATEIGVIGFWRVIIDAPPANDAFATPRVLAGALPLADLNARTDFATTEAGEPIVSGDGALTAWWTWTPTATQDVVIQAAGSSGYNPSVAVYTGTALGSLVRVAHARQASGLDPARAVLHAVAGTPYHIQLNGLAGSNGEADLTISLAAAPVLPADAAASTALGAFFSAYLTVTSGDPLTVTVTGTPPPGMSVTLAEPPAHRRLLSGTPTTAGSYTLTMTAANTQGSDTRTITLFVTEVPVLTNPPLATGIVGQPFSFFLTATSSPTSYGAVSLPPGLAINALSGEISGTPTGTGSASYTVSATNAHGTGSQSLAILINPAGAPVVTSAGTLAAVAGVPFSYGITTTPAATSYGAELWLPGVAGSTPLLPAGVTVDTASGALAGTIATPGTYRFVVGGTNASGTGARGLVITVSPAPGGSGTSTSGSGGGVDADGGGCGLASGTAALLALSALALGRRRRR